MSSHSTDTADFEETYGPDESDAKSESRRLLSGIATYARNGTLPMLAGAVLLADAARTARRSRRRASLCAFAGGALLGVGVRQQGRNSSDESEPTADESGAYADTESIGIEDDAGEVSDEARAHRERSDVLHESETNPRGVSDEPDVETETGPDEGEIRFTTEQSESPAPRPHLEESHADDPRRSEEDPTADEDDDHVEVDLSEVAMADEASEATGPDPEQAYPSLEGTDPEPMSEEAPPRVNEGAVPNAESLDSDAESASESTDAGDGDDADARTEADADTDEAAR